MKIVVQRAFLLGGVRQEPGTTVEVADPLGIELVAMGKAERAAGEPAPVRGRMTTTSVAALVSGPVAAQQAIPAAPPPAPVAEPAVAPADSAPFRRRRGNQDAE